MTRLFPALLLIVLSGCQSKLPLAPTPEVLKDPRFNLFDAYPEPDEIHLINALFASTRLPSSRDPNQFTSTPDDLVHYGIVALQIADAEEAENLRAQSTTSTREMDFHWQVNGITPLGATPRQDEPSPACTDASGAEAFIETARSYHERLPLKELTIYVHGANNNFEASVSRGGQAQYFSGDNAPILTFAWPSPGNIFGYGIDRARSNRAATDLACLMGLLAANTDFERFHLLGYSAGGRVAAGALALLGQAGIDGLRVGHVYLAASDQPLETFARELPLYYGLIDTLTITTAAKDPVLALSRITDLQPRLGAPQGGSAEHLAATGVDLDGLRELINSEKVTLVDLGFSEIPGFEFSHGAWYENPWVSTDAMVAVLAGLNAEQRALASYEEDGFTSWYFPADYLETLKANLLSLAEDDNR